LLEKPSDQQSPRRIGCYSIDVQDLDVATKLWKLVGFEYKIDPQRVLLQHRLRSQRHATRSEIVRDPRRGVLV